MSDEYRHAQVTEKDFKPPRPDIQATVNALIAAYFPELAGDRLIVACRETGLDVGDGQITVAATGVNSDASAPFDFMIWFACDVWDILDARGRMGIVFHELRHCDWDEDGTPILRPHDAGVFNEEVELYSDWWKAAQERYHEMNSAQQGEKV